MEPPESLSIGPRWLRDAVNAVRDFAVATRPLRSETCEVHETPQGTQILPQAQKATPAATVSYHPLQPVAVDNTHLRVYFGTVGNAVPVGMNEGDDPPFLLPVSGAGFVIATLTLDELGYPASAAITAPDTLPDPGDNVPYVILGSFSTEDDDSLSVADDCQNSFQYQRCGYDPDHYQHLFWT